MASRSLGTLTLDLIAKIGGFQQGMNQAAQSVAKTADAADAASTRVAALESQFLSLSNIASKIAGPLAAAFSVQAIYEATEAYGSLTNRLKLVTSGSAELAAAQASVFGIAQDARQPLSSTAELYQRIATNQNALKLSGEGVAGVVGTISKTLAISGASAESADAALVQLGQAFASGTLRGEELNSVLEQAPALAQAIANGMGVTVGELRNLGSQGLLTAQAVVKALQSQAGAVDTLFSKMTATIGGSLTVVGNSLTHFVGEIDQATGTTGKLATKIVAVSKEIDGSLPAAMKGIQNNSDALSQALTTGLYVALARVSAGYTQQAAAALASTVANRDALRATADSAAKDLLAAKSKQEDAKAALSRAAAELSAAESKVGADRLRVSSELASVQAVQASLVAERALEQQRLAAQISEKGRMASISRLAELRTSEMAIIKQVESAERALAATTVSASAEVQAAYAKRAAAAAGVAETTLAANALSAVSKSAADAASAATITSRAFGALATAGRSVLTLMGGPVGLAFIAGAAALSFVDFRSSADKAAEGLEGLKGPLDDVIAKFKTLTQDQKAAALVKWGEAEAEGIKAAGEEYSKLQSMLKTGLVGPRSSETGTSIYADYAKQLDAAKASGQSLSPILEKLKADARVDPKLSDSLVKQAGAYSTIQQSADQARDRINAINGEMNKGTAAATGNAQATTGMTTAGEKYLQTMQQQLGKLQDNNDAVKEANRYLDDHKELSGADRIAILSTANAIKAQTEANKAATQEAKNNAKAQTSLAQQLKQAASGYEDLKKQFDPVGAAAHEFKVSTEQINLLYKNGKISQQEYADGTQYLAERFNTAVKASNNLAQAELYRADLQKQLANSMAQYANQAAAVGQGDKESDRAQQRLAIEKETNDKLLSLRTELANATTDKQRKDLQAQIDLTNEYLPKQISAMQDGFKQIDAAQSDWTNGARSAFQNYADQAADVAGQTKTLFSNAFTNMEDGIIDFVKTGKLNFKDFADGVIEDLIRIQVRQAAAGFLGTAFSFLSGGSAALGAGVMTGSSTPLAAVPNAKGGVYDSPSLSAYSNQIYNSPQMFAFAKGAGVFAEAGPEAIMPLTRAADGSLGVRALGTGDTSAAESAADTGATSIGGITQYLTIQGSADDATLARIQQAARQGAQGGYALVLRDLKQNGPVRQMLNRR
jgi:lambda family phage tail tape measure protein